MNDGGRHLLAENELSVECRALLRDVAWKHMGAHGNTAAIDPLVAQQPILVGRNQDSSKQVLLECGVTLACMVVFPYGMANWHKKMVISQGHQHFSTLFINLKHVFLCLAVDFFPEQSPMFGDVYRADGLAGFVVGPSSRVMDSHLLLCPVAFG